MRLPGPGVHRVVDGPGPALDALRERGWRAVAVRPGPSATQFHTALAEALELPAWYGGTLDALWDCLTDLDGPTALVLLGWRDLLDVQPEAWRAFVSLFDERAEHEPPFAVLLT